MNPGAWTIEALPAIIILTAFVLVMVKIFVINQFGERRKTKKQKESNGNCCTKSGKCIL